LKAGGGFGSRHPAPAGFYPGHPANFEVGRCAEVLFFDSEDGDGGGVYSVDCHCVFVIQGADLPLWHGFKGEHLGWVRFLTLCWNVGRRMRNMEELLDQLRLRCHDTFSPKGGSVQNGVAELPLIGPLTT